jgi:hypothetical protein
MLGGTGSVEIATDLPAGRGRLRGKGSSLSRALLGAALLAIALGAALWAGLGVESSRVPPAAHSTASFPKRASVLAITTGRPSEGAPGGGNPAAYRIGASGGGLQAANPAQRLLERFSRSGTVVSSGRIRLGLSLREVGYGSSLRRLSAVSPNTKANRVLYARPGLVEWYVNGPQGLEQGFTLSRAPSGHRAGPLTLSLALSGNARASLATDGRSLILSHSGASVNYSGLQASDARGRTLPSWLQLNAGRLLLRVDTRGARYPLVIDPTITKI